MFTDRYRPDQQRRKQYEKSHDPVWDTSSWRSFVKAGEKAALTLANRYVRGRYEDPVDDRAAQVDRIAQLVGIEARTGALAVQTNNAVDPDQVRAGIDGASVGRWRETLPRGEVKACELVARRELAMLGYALEAPAAEIGLASSLGDAAIEPGVLLYRHLRRYRRGGPAFVSAPSWQVRAAVAPWTFGLI